MTHVNEYLNFLYNLQGLAGGLFVVMLLVYLWWIGKNIK